MVPSIITEVPSCAWNAVVLPSPQPMSPAASFRPTPIDVSV
jgi:hypothetical protein